MFPPPNQTRILICDDLHEKALECFRQAGYEPELRLGMSEDELVATVPGAHALVVRSATKITARVLAAADSLAVVGRAGVGVDNVDCDAATMRGVVVMNTPTGNTTTTGELAIALLTSIARHIPRADRQTRTGNWKKKALMGTELTGKTLGVVGLGRIGRVVATRALGLSMNVIASDPFLTKTGASSPIDDVILTSLEDLLARSDFVTLHVPITDDTRNLLSRERLAMMKRGARLINAARGGLVDEIALADALESGHLAGAALDVLAQEPPAPDNPLLGREDVILTPHLGASSHEAQENVAVGIAEQISTYFQQGVAHNAINAPAVSDHTLKSLRHYILLAEKMGRYLAQRTVDPIRKIEFTVSGDVQTEDDGYLALTFLVAVLGQGLEGGVNFVNAPGLAKERGIRILTSAEEESAFFPSQLKARVSTKAGGESHVVTGTVFGEQPRFVRIDETHVDLAPEGVMLITKHNDRPGVLGAIGTILGKASINIRRAELGPAHQSPDGLASAFLTLYDDPGDQVVEQVSAVDGIQLVRRIRLG